MVNLIFLTNKKMQLLNCHLPDICSMDYYIYSFFSFAFDAKETKDQGKKNAPPFFRPTHNDSDYLKSLYWFCSGWCKTLLPDLAGTERHCVPPC